MKKTGQQRKSTSLKLAVWEIPFFAWQIPTFLTIGLAILAPILSSQNLSGLSTIVQNLSYVSGLISIIALMFTLNHDILKRLESKDVLLQSLTILPTANSLEKLSYIIKNVELIEQYNKNNSYNQHYDIPPAIIILDHFVDYIERVANGFIPLDSGERMRFVTTKLTSVRSELVAVGFNDIDSWWSGASGDDYFKKNEEIIKAGKIIERIYIISDHEKKDIKFKKWCDAQLSLKKGNNNYSFFLVDSSKLLRLHPDLAISFLIFDREFVTISNYFTGISREKIGGISYNPRDIKQYFNYFETLRRYTMTNEEINELIR